LEKSVIYSSCLDGQAHSDLFLEKTVMARILGDPLVTSEPIQSGTLAQTADKPRGPIRKYPRRKRVIVKLYDAVGGPKDKHKAHDGYPAGPTDSGVFRVWRCVKHSSTSYPKWSKIKWGSKIEERAGEIFVEHDGKMQPISDLTTVTRIELITRYSQLYGVVKMPDKWVFNDFGHVTCKYFKDQNYNMILDKDEQIHTEYIHPTPKDEALSARGAVVDLDVSHGCIHVKPKDIDEMIDKGYLKTRNKVVVHKYNEFIPNLPQDDKGGPPYEVHFYPGRKLIIVIGRKL